MRVGAFVLLVLLPAFAFGASDDETMTIGMDVQDMALLAFTIPDLITLDIAAPASAGLVPVNDTTHTTVRLLYTSCVPFGQTRKVQVNFDAVDPNRPPAGTELRVVANPVPTNTGTTAGSVTIDDDAQDFVTTIGSCRTGTAATNGPRIRYTFAVTDASQLVVTSVTVTVVYTLTDAS